MTYQNHWKSIWECILPLGVHTTSVFRDIPMTYQNHWKSIWECILPLGVHTASVFHRKANDLSESLEVNLGLQTTCVFLWIPWLIRITGSQFGSIYYQCIPEKFQWLIRISGSQFGSAYYQCVPVKFQWLISESLEVKLGVHTTSVFQRNSNAFYQNKSIWKCIQVYSREIPMIYIRITGSQFGSAYYHWECILPVYSREISMTFIRITGSQFGNAYYKCIPEKFPRLLSESLEVNLGLHTTCVFQWIPWLFSKSLEVNMGVRLLPVYSSKIPMTFIRITVSQFGSEYDQCIPVKFQWLFITITGTQFDTGFSHILMTYDLFMGIVSLEVDASVVHLLITMQTV